MKKQQATNGRGGLDETWLLPAPNIHAVAIWSAQRELTEVAATFAEVLLGPRAKGVRMRTGPEAH